MSIAIGARNTLIGLLIAVSILVSIHVTGIYYILTHETEVLFNNLPFVFRNFNLYNLDAEKNLPTFFSVCILLIASALLITIGMNQTSRVKFFQWLFLGVIFLFLAFDESSDAHLNFAQLLNYNSPPTGYFHFTWVIPYSIITFSIFLLYITFLYRLPRRIAVLFLASGAIYVAGALGFEMIAGEHIERIGERDILYWTYATVEEGLEMLGISIFIYALLSYISGTSQTLSIRVSK